MNEREPPLADIGTEFVLAADRARQAVEAEKEAVRNAVEKYFNDLDAALVSFASIARRVGGMPSLRQAEANHLVEGALAQRIATDPDWWCDYEIRQQVRQVIAGLAREALSASPAPVGWTGEPTEEMKLAGADVLRQTRLNSREYAASATFQAMCAASPSPAPTQTPEISMKIYSQEEGVQMRLAEIGPPLQGLKVVPKLADPIMLRAALGWREADSREGLSGEEDMFERAYYRMVAVAPTYDISKRLEAADSAPTQASPPEYAQIQSNLRHFAVHAAHIPGVANLELAATAIQSLQGRVRKLEELGTYHVARHVSDVLARQEAEERLEAVDAAQPDREA